MQLHTDREEHENRKDDIIHTATGDWVGWKEVYGMEIVVVQRFFITMPPNFLDAYSVVTDLALQIQIGEVRGFYSER
jgi:hypothetical protein